MKLINENTLLKEYNIYGHFYQITLGNEILADCRSTLEIFRNNNINFNTDNFFEHRPDVLFIMMNPGLCDSRDSLLHEKIDVNNFKIEYYNKKFVNTTIDSTLQRIMTVGLIKRWNHLRVINLSDIRFRSDIKFKVLLDCFELKTHSSIHSIFHPNRRDELKYTISGCDRSNIILACGVERFLDKYIDYASEIIDYKHCYGIRNYEGRYYHPLTSKISWVEEILLQLNI